MMLKNLKEWSKKINDISASTRRPGSKYPWPSHSPKFLGFIMTMFNVNQRWEEGK